MLNEIIQSDDNKRQHHLEPKTHKRVNKNTPKDIDLNLKAYQLFEGTDLLAIEGMSYSTVMALMSEVGPEGITKGLKQPNTLPVGCVSPPTTK
jgi:transposase